MGKVSHCLIPRPRGQAQPFQLWLCLGEGAVRPQRGPGVGTYAESGPTQFDDFRKKLPKNIRKLCVKGECDSVTGSHLIHGLITKITPIRA